MIDRSKYCVLVIWKVLAEINLIKLSSIKESSRTGSKLISVLV
jgi:hypothetical protein